jgi:hypothetical protein
VEGVRERTGDLGRMQVLGAGRDVVAVALEPAVVVRRDPVAEHVNRLLLAPEAGRQLLGDEHVGAVGEVEHAADRVVVGDRHEVHSAPLGHS